MERTHGSAGYVKLKELLLDHYYFNLKQLHDFDPDFDEGFLDVQYWKKHRNAIRSNYKVKENINLRSCLTECAD